MQEVLIKKNSVTVSASGACIYSIESNAPSAEYPRSFLEVVKAWKRYVMKEGCSPSDSRFEGDGLGCALVLATCLWCRDHGIPLPSGIVLRDPVIAPSEGADSPYFSTADVDDPCAFPLIADYYGFPSVSLEIHGNSMLKTQAESLHRRLSEQDISSEVKVIS